MLFNPICIFAENFKTIRKIQFNLDRPYGVHLVCGENEEEERLGSNGAGKSSILVDALCFCLFGSTPDGLRGPDLIPWETNLTVKVSLIFRLDNNRYVLTRTANPNNLVLDGKEIDQAALEKKLGMTKDLYCHTLALGQGQALFFDLTPAKKMELFSEVLLLERWERRSDLAKKRADALQSDADTLKGKLEGLLRQYHEVRKLHEEAEIWSQDWIASQKKHQREVEVKLKEIKPHLAKLQRRYDDAELAWDSAETELKPLREEVDVLVEHCRKRESALAGMKGRLEAAREEHFRLEDQLAAASAGKCPICGGPLKDDKHIKKLQKRMEDINIKAFEDIIYNDETKLTDNKKTAARLIASHKQFADKAERARDEMQTVLKPLTEAKQQFTALSKQAQDYREERNPHTFKVSELKRRRTQLWEEYQDGKENLAALWEQIERTRYWVKGFKDLALFLIEEVLQELELASNLMLEQLGLIGWELHYATEKETKSGSVKRGMVVTVKSPRNKSAVRWECWSGGEGQRLRLLGALALSEVLLARAGIETTVETLDEPSSHLSPEGVEDLCIFLHDRAQALRRTIFFVEQNVIQSNLFASTIMVQRTKSQGTTVSSGN